MTPSEARNRLGKIAERWAGRQQLAKEAFRTFCREHRDHLLSALHVWSKTFGGTFDMGMPGDRWVVVGTNRNGEPYIDEAEQEGACQTLPRAEYLANRENSRGGDVKVVREVWNGPKASWEKPRE